MDEVSEEMATAVMEENLVALTKPKSMMLKWNGDPNYHTAIDWGNGYEKWNMVRFATPADGSCFFHSIANAFFTPYHTEVFNGKKVSKTEIVAHLRKELADKLSEKVVGNDKLRYYDILNNGNTSNFSKQVPEFSMERMQSELASNHPIGYGYLEFVGNQLDKDIFILDAERNDVYITNEEDLTIKNRNSIVLYYIGAHYELVGILNDSHSYDTYFHPQHSFIQFLKDRINNLKDTQCYIE